MQFSQQQMLMQQQQQQMAFNANAQTLQPERHSLSQNGGAEIAGGLHSNISIIPILLHQFQNNVLRKTEPLVL